MNWDDEDWELEPIIPSSSSKESFDFNEEEDDDSKGIKIKHKKILKNPLKNTKEITDLEYSKKEDTVTIYCTGINSGNKRKGRKLIGFLLLDHKGSIIKSDTKFLGIELDKKLLIYYALIHSLEEAKNLKYKKTIVYTDLKIPPLEEILTHSYFDPNHKKSLYYVIKVFEEYNFCNIPKKLNWYVLNLIDQEIENIKKSSSLIYKKNKLEQKNLKNFMNRKL